MFFGCCINTVEDIQNAAAAGFDFYEYAGAAVARMSDGYFAQICELTEKLGLPCLGFNAYSSGIPAIVGNTFDPKQAEDYAELICARGALLGIRSIGIGSPRARLLPDGFSKAAADRQCRQFLEITCSIAARYGLSVLLEAVHDGMCNYINTTSEAVTMVQQLNLSNLGLVLDFYHMEVMGEALSSVPLSAPYLAHTHISSCGADLSRGFPTESEREIYSQRFAALRAINYNGTVSIEPDHFDCGSAARSLAMLKNL